MPENINQTMQSRIIISFRLRDEIWMACLMLDDDVIVSVLDNGSFFCNKPTRITPALLRVNQQVKMEARAILFGKNIFSIELSIERSIRTTREEELTNPTCTTLWMWNSTFRTQLYQISRLRIVVRLRQDQGSERLTEGAITTRQQNMKWFKEMKSDIEVLLGWLQTSSSVKYLTISLSINGTMSESNCPLILRTFEGWTGLTEVEVIGAPRNFATNLKRIMEESTDANATVLERSRQKFACETTTA